jgi:hypothetical protein
MRVPEYWWPGYNGYRLHDSKIDSFDISEPKWNLILDDRNEPFPFLMAYDAVSMYANEDSSTIEKYQLPYQAVFEGDNEIETEGNRYARTPTSEWTEVELNNGEDERGGRRIDPIEWTGEEVDVLNIIDEELTGLVLWPYIYGHFLGYFFYGGVSPSKNRS